MHRVRQILFVPPAPIVWANHLKAFERHGLDVETTLTVSSDQIGQGLADGTWDVGIGVIDNILAWSAMFGGDLRILQQLERSQPMAFCARAGVASLEDAARGTVAVDALGNGFVLVLYRALARAGIERSAVRFDPVGGVRQRFEALLAGSVRATMLVPPFIDLAVAQGCRVLFDGREHAPSYPGVVSGARAAWLRAQPEVADAYRRALGEANAWAADPANRDAAVAALVDSRYSPAAARRLVDSVVPELAVSRDGWRETVELRREAGLLEEPEPKFEAVVPWSAGAG